MTIPRLSAHHFHTEATGENDLLYGEILHTSAVLVGTIHVIQGIYINWREPAFSSVVCKQKVCLTTKRRMAKEMQVVGGPNSVRLASRCLNCDLFTTTSISWYFYRIVP